MQIDTHVYGSFDGYQTLGCSEGVTSAERAELEEMGFGQPSNPDDLLLLKDRPCVLGRPLRSGRMAITRAFPGRKDDVGRPTILLATLVMTQDEFHKIRPGLRGLVGNHDIWNPAKFRSFSPIEVSSGVHSNDRPPDDAWYLADMWIDVVGRQDQLLVFPDEPRSEEAILDLVSRLQPQDAVQVRWGIWLLSAGAPADVCTLSGFASGSIRRKVHRCQISSSFRHEAAGFFFKSRGKSDGFLPARQILAAPPPAIHDRLQFGDSDGLPGMESTGVNRRRRRPWQMPLAISLAAMFIIAATLGIVYLIPWDPESDPTLVADAGESESPSPDDSATGSATKEREDSRKSERVETQASPPSPPSSPPSPPSSPAEKGLNLTAQIDAQKAWGLFDTDGWKKIRDDCPDDSESKKSIDDAIKLATKVLELLDGTNPFAPQQWAALKITHATVSKDLGVEKSVESLLRQVDGGRNIEKWNKEMAPSVKGTLILADGVTPENNSLIELYGKIEGFKGDVSAAHPTGEKSSGPLPPDKKYDHLKDPPGRVGDPKQFWGAAAEDLRGYTWVGWLVAISSESEANQWEFRALGATNAVRDLDTSAERYFISETKNDEGWSLELKRFGPDVEEKLNTKPSESSTHTQLMIPERSEGDVFRQLLLVFRPLGWKEVEDVAQTKTPDPNSKQVGSSASEPSRSKIPEDFAESAWTNLKPGKKPTGFDPSQGRKVKKAVESWGTPPKIPEVFTDQEIEDEKKPKPLDWENIDLGPFENQPGQSWNTKETDLKDAVTKGLDDPEGWPDSRKQLAVFLKPFVSEGLFLIEPPDLKLRKKMGMDQTESFKAFHLILQTPESFFEQMKTGKRQCSIDACSDRVEYWKRVIEKRLETIKKWDELEIRTTVLVENLKIEWLRMLETRYLGILKNLEDEKKRLDQYRDREGLAGAEIRKSNELKKELDDQITEVSEALGIVNLILKGKNIEMSELWPSSKAIMPREFREKALVEVLKKLKYELKLVFDQLEVEPAP